MTYEELCVHLANIDGASAALSCAEKTARAEGVREGMLKAAEIGADAAVEYWTEAKKPVSQRKYGGNGLPGCVSAAIRAAAPAKIGGPSAAAEAQP